MDIGLYDVRGTAESIIAVDEDAISGLWIPTYLTAIFRECASIMGVFELWPEAYDRVL